MIRLLFATLTTVAAMHLLAHAATARTYTTVVLKDSTFNSAAGYGISGNQKVGLGVEPPPNRFLHAALWTNNTSNVVDLHPSGWLSSLAYDTNGTMQVGAGRRTTIGESRALLWSGTASSFVDLTPPGWNWSIARGIDGTMQIGSGSVSSTSSPRRALIWNGTPSSFVNLHPTGLQWSDGLAGHGGQQVGLVIDTFGTHAALWSGTAASFVDLHPTGATYSVANDIYSGQPVGEAEFAGVIHAALWNNTGFVDLHPTGFSSSSASGIGNGIQVGVGTGTPTGGQVHALAWFNSANTVLDLHQFLPTPADYLESRARSVDPVTGHIVGEAFNRRTLRSDAIVWIPVPEPSSTFILLSAISLFVLQRLAPSLNASGSSS